MNKVRFKLLTAILIFMAIGTAVSAQSEALPAPGLDVVGHGYNVFGKYAEMESIIV